MKQDNKELCGWFIFCQGQQLLVVKEGDRFHIPYATEPPVRVTADTTIHAIGEIQGHPAKAYALPLEELNGKEDSHGVCITQQGYPSLAVLHREARRCCQLNHIGSHGYF